MAEENINNNDKTHFGFKDVPASEKAGMVRGVFDSVADKYDVMNDAMSLGVHRIWKRYAIEIAGLKPGDKVLDLASGTGDLALKMSPQVGDDGLVVMSDINYRMLKNGRKRMLDNGLASNIDYVLANAENLPFPDNYFDCITMAFGLRNVTDKDKALRSMCRVLKPGGKLLVLEFSKPTSEPFSKVYDFYSFNIKNSINRIPVQRVTA
jgi:demethylmenaquinone methyltransferase / 2-methoxy-6-polyprenyl-1,4-benzoquinol methylase